MKLAILFAVATYILEPFALYDWLQGSSFPHVEPTITIACFWVAFSFTVVRLSTLGGRDA